MGPESTGKSGIVKGEDDRTSASARAESTSDACDLRWIDPAEGFVEKQHPASIDLGECTGDGDTLTLAARKCGEGDFGSVQKPDLAKRAVNCGVIAPNGETPEPDDVTRGEGCADLRALGHERALRGQRPLARIGHHALRAGGRFEPG